MKRIKNIHFVGIGGIGMCGIAEVLLNQGYHVTGSDIAESDNILRLRELGAEVAIQHMAENNKDADVLVTSSAVEKSNPEITAAHAAKIPVVPRAEMLSELMRTKYGIAIAGTHGKTTTTSMIASMLDSAAMNPTYVIGGRLLHNDKNASLGTSEYFVAEADESDGSFLLFHPVISVVTNIDNDHLGIYRNDINNLIDAFKQFIMDIPFYGCAVLCKDDEHISRLLPDIHRRVLTYGFHQDAMVYCTTMSQSSSGIEMQVVSDMYDFNTTFKLKLFGRHNAMNALASICVGLELGLSISQIALSLAEFQGISRRLNVYSATLSDNRHISIIDDYGHHPTEIKSVLNTIIDVFQGQRVIFVFEPHRYSRVKALFDGFIEAMLGADYQLVLPIYAANETDIPSVSSAVICDSLRSLGAKNAHAVESIESLLSVLDHVVENNDVVLFMGAGEIGNVVKQYLAEVSL